MDRNKKTIKSIILSVFLLFPVSLESNNSLDSLLDTRASLVDQYREIISSPRASPDTERRIFYLQNQIIETDDVLLEMHLQALQQENLLLKQSLQEAQLRQLDAEKEASRANKELTDQQRLFYGVSGTLFLLVVLFLSLTTVYSVRNRKLKSRIQEADRAARQPASRSASGEKPSEQQAADLSSLQEAEQLRGRVAELESQARENHIRIIGLKSEKQKLEDQLQTLEANRPSSPLQPMEKDDPERLVLEHQLTEARAMLEDLTDKNKILSQELEKTIQAEKNLIEEISSVKQEAEEAKSHKQELMRQLKIAQGSLMQSTRAQTDDKRAEKLEKQIEIYREQLQAEQTVREKFEKDIYAILEAYGLKGK